MKLLFEYAVLYHPKATREEKDAGEEPGSEILIPPTHILASNEKEAVMLVARALPEDCMSKLEQVEIKIRPF